MSSTLVPITERVPSEPPSCKLKVLELFVRTGLVASEIAAERLIERGIKLGWMFLADPRNPVTYGATAPQRSLEDLEDQEVVEVGDMLILYVAGGTTKQAHTLVKGITEVEAEFDLKPDAEAAYRLRMSQKHPGNAQDRKVAYQPDSTPPGTDYGSRTAPMSGYGAEPYPSRDFSGRQAGEAARGIAFFLLMLFGGIVAAFGVTVYSSANDAIREIEAYRSGAGGIGVLSFAVADALSGGEIQNQLAQLRIVRAVSVGITVLGGVLTIYGLLKSAR